jgi:hypothetical protein
LEGRYRRPPKPPSRKCDLWGSDGGFRGVGMVGGIMGDRLAIDQG